MAHKVKCYYCGKMFDADVNPYVMVNSRRYAHKSCADRQGSEGKDKLEQYLITLFKLRYLHPTIAKQIEEFKTEKQMSYTEIYNVLFYYYDIMRNKPPLATPNIGIVPYVYPQAKAYFEKLYKSKVVNEGKNMRDYRPEVKKITIRAPEREPLRKRPLFTFLDEEEVEDGE